MRPLVPIAALTFASIAFACQERAKPTRETSPAVVEAVSASEPPTSAALPVAPVQQLEKVGPKGNVAIGRIVSDYPVPEAEPVINSFRADFANCYEAELKKAPALVGRADLVMVVEPVGSLVGLPRSEKVQGLPAELTSCMVKQVGNVRFKGFSGRRATLRIPITFALVRPDAGVR